MCLRLAASGQPTAARPCALNAKQMSRATEQSLLPKRRLHEFVDAVEGMQLRAVEYSSLVPPAKRAANLAAFRSGRAQVRRCPADAP